MNMIDTAGMGDGKSASMPSGAEDEDDKDGDEEDEDCEFGELQLLRRNGGFVSKEPATCASSVDKDAAKSNSQDARWWHTFQYRPIMGIVPLFSTARSETRTNGAGECQALQPPLVEMALVERPVWELDLPPRYLAEHERRER